MGFVKIHDQILTSSILEEDVVVRWVWICLLVSCDKFGNVYGTPQALARMANVSLEKFQSALGVLMGPDPNSTSPDEDGRRVIEASPNVLHCVNYSHYRGLRDPEEEREAARIRKRRQREREKALESTSTQKVTQVTTSSRDVTKSHDKAEAEAEAEADIKKTSSSSSSRKDDAAFVARVIEYWQGAGLKPEVRTVNASRKSSIIARRREHGEEAVMMMLKNRTESSFLNFKIFDGRGAPLDWCFGPKNFVKVADGNYNDGTKGGPRGKSGTNYDDVL